MSGGGGYSEAAAVRPRSCQLTGGSGLQVELWVGGQSRPPRGAWGLAHQVPGQPSLPKEWKPQNGSRIAVAWLLGAFCPRSSLCLSHGCAGECSDSPGL